MSDRHEELRFIDGCAFASFGAFLGLIVGGIAGAKVEAMITREHAISCEAAHYDPRTGEFVWDVPGMKEAK